MTEAAKWMDQIHAYFDKHPEHQFHLTTIPIVALAGVSGAGWIVGMASVPHGRPAQPSVPPGYNAITCIVRGPDSAEGRPLPGVFLMDGARPALSQGGSARDKEQFCERIWGLVQVASALNVSLAALMLDPEKLEAAFAAITPAGARKDAPQRA
ncbi:MAG: hypothetical protein CMH66_04825 [Nioella sp.]|nr:hypothetical protein [Nioella sp.]